MDVCTPPTHAPIPASHVEPLPSPFARRKLGGSVSIVGTDVNEEVVSRALPAITPGTKAKPLRKPLGERTNGATTAKKTRGLDDDAVTGLTNALKTAAKAAKKKDGDIASKENGADYSEFADLPTDPLERGLALVRKGVEAMRTGGVDPKEALLKFAKKPKSGPNVREAAATVVNRLLETLEAAADDKSDTSRELDYSGGSDDENNESKDVEAVDDKEEVEEDDSEDVFATATNSPVKSISGASDSAGVAADDLSAALQGMTVTVEEGVMGCGDENCGSGPDGACDPLECMRRAGGPFKMPAKLVKQPSTVSTARSSPPEEKDAPVVDEKEDEEDEEDEEEEANESAAEESVLATDDDEDAADEEEDDESVADTASVAGTDSQEESSMADLAAVEAAAEADAAEGSPMMSPGPEVVDVSDLPDGTPLAEPVPDAPIVIDADDADEECDDDDEVTSKATPPAMNATVREKLDSSAEDDGADETGYQEDDDEMPVSARRTPGRRSRAVVDSSDEDEADDEKTSSREGEGKGSGESTSPGTPPAANTPPAQPVFNVPPPTTGRKSILRRIASNRKARAEREAREAAMRAPNFDDDAANFVAASSEPSTAVSAPAAALAATQPKAFPKSALKKSSKYAAAPAPTPEVSEEASTAADAVTPARRRPQRKAVIESARKKALAWIDDEASDDENDDEEEDEDEACSADDDFVCDDDDVEYDSDASSNAIAEDIHARSGGVMPNVTPSPEVPKTVSRAPKSILKGRTPGKTPGKGSRLTFGDDDVKHMTDSEGEGSSPEPDENDPRAPRTMVAKGTAQDPYGLDDLKTPTPPRPLAEVLNEARTPSWAKTPNTAGRKTVGFGASFGNEPPPTHSKALAAALASAAKPGKTLNYGKHKETIARALYNEFNADAFDGKLPAKLEISWNAKLLTTAGLTHYKKVTRSTGLSEYSARIELSTKVLDSAEKLEATLLHEMCHAAAWLLDHQAKPPHGETFKKWAKQAMRTYPDVSVDTCHSYEIFQPYRYRCTQQWCNTEYGRHSKSIDVEAKACGVCNGRLEYLGKFNPDGSKAEEKPPTAFSLFVKEHFAATKERMPAGTPHKNIMKELSGLWKSGGGTTGKKTRGGDDEALSPDALGESMRTLKL